MRIHLKNFRSIQELEMEIGPITVIYGHNGSGKSSILYALQVMKNIVLNPNQQVDNFFNLGFTNLGGFEQVVFKHDKRRKVLLEIEVKYKEKKMRYGVFVGERDGRFILSEGMVVKKKEFVCDVSFPYPANKGVDILFFKVDGKSISSRWDGLTLHSPRGVPAEIQEKANEYLEIYNAPAEMVRKFTLIPLKRGFSKPTYSPMATTPTPYTEDEIATLLGNDAYFEEKVNSYCQQVFKKDFRVRPKIGTSIFSLMVGEKGLATELVNEGFGLNQAVFMFAMMLKEKGSLVGIEEPEIHLHPTAQRELVHSFIKMVREEGITIILTTHSENILSALLSAVATKKIAPKDVACYLCTKTTKEGTKIERQEVNEKGQIKGGLGSFMEAELKDLKEMLAASGE